MGKAPPPTKRVWQIGDLVLCKIKGHSLWPAEIADPLEHDKPTKPGQYFVAFFGCTDWAYCKNSNVFPFEGKVKDTILVSAKSKALLQAALDQFLIIWEDRERRNLVCGSSSGGQGGHPMIAATEVNEDVGDAADIIPAREQEHEVKAVVPDPSVGDEEDDVQLVEERPSSKKGRKKRQGSLLQMTGKRGLKRRKVQPAEAVMGNDDVPRDGANCAEGVKEIQEEHNIAGQMEDVSLQSPSLTRRGRAPKQERARFPSARPSVHVESLSVQIRVDGADPAAGDVGAGPMTGMPHAQLEGVVKRKPGRPRKRDKDPAVGQQLPRGDCVPDSTVAPSFLLLNVPPKRMRTLNGLGCIEGELFDLDRTITQKRGRARLERKPQAKASVDDLQNVVEMVSISGGCEEVKMVRKCGRPSKQGNRLQHSIERDEKGTADEVVTAASRPGEAFAGQIPVAVVSDIGGGRSFACTATVMRADSAGGERRKGRCGWGSVGVHDASLGKVLAHDEPKVGEKVSAEERARIAAEEAEEAAVILVEGPELKDIRTPRVSRGPRGQRQSSEEVAVPRGEIDMASVLDISNGVIAGSGPVRPRNIGKRGRKRGIKGGVEMSIPTAPMIEDGLAVLAGEAGAVESRDTGARSPVAVKMRNRKPRKATSERPSVSVRNAREDGLAELPCEAHEVEVNIGASVVSVLESTKRRGRPRKVVLPGEVQAKTAAVQEAVMTVLRKSSAVERSLMSSVELAEEGKDGQPSVAEQVGVKSRGDVGVSLEGNRPDRHTNAVEEMAAVMTAQTTPDAPSEREGDVVENAKFQADAAAFSEPGLLATSRPDADLVLDHRTDSLGLATVKLQTGGPALQEEGIGGIAGKKGRSGSAVRRKGLAKGVEHVKDVRGTLQGKTGGGAGLSLMPPSLNAGTPQSSSKGLIRVGSGASVPVPKALKGLLESAAGELAAEGDNVAFSPEIAKSIQQGSKPSGDQKLGASSAGADAVKIQGIGREGVQEQRKMGAKEMSVARAEKLARGVKGKVATIEAAVHKAGSDKVAEKPMLVECYGLGVGKASNGGGTHEEKGDGRKKNSPRPGPAPARTPVEEAKDKLRLSYAAAKEKKARRVVKVLDGKVSVKAPLQSNWPPEMLCRKEKAAPNMGALIAEAKAKQQALALKKVPPAEPDGAKPQAFPGSQETSSGDTGPLSMHLESEKEERVGMTSIRLVDAPMTDFGLPVGSTRMSVSPIEGAGSAEAPIAGLLVGLDMDAVVTLEAFEGMLETLSRNRDSISRATKHAMAAARLGLAEKVIAVILQRLETERSMPKRVDLFFLVDSIAQAANRKRGTDSLYKPFVESALLRFLTAAAPPGSPARANRKDCLKVLKVWHERDILPKPMLEHYMAEIKKNDAKLGSPRPARWAQRGVDDPLRHMEGFVDEYGSNAFFSTMGLSLKLNNEDDFDEEYSEPDEGNHNVAAPSLVPVLEQPSPEKAPEEAVLASEWEPQPSPKGTPFSMKETPFSGKEAQPHPSCENTEAPMDTSPNDTNTRDDDNKPRFSEVQGSSVPSTSPQYCPESAGESVYFLSTPPAESPCAMPPLPPSPPPSPPPLPEEPPPPWSPPRPSPIATPPSMAPSTFEVPAERTDGVIPAASSGRWPPVMPGVHVRGLEASALPGGFPEVHQHMQWTHSASPGFGMTAATQQRVSPKEPRQVAVTSPPVFTPRPPSVPPPPNVGQYRNHHPPSGGYLDKGVGGGSASKSWLSPPTLDQQKLAGGGGAASPLAEVEGGAERQVPGGVEHRGGKDISPEVLGKDVLSLERSVQRLKCDQFTKEGGAVDALLLPPPLPSGLPPIVKLSPTAPVHPPRTLPPWSAPSQPVLTTSTYTTVQNNSAPRPHPQGPGALSAAPRPPQLGQPSCMAPAAVLMAGGYGTQVGNSVPATRPMGVVGMYNIPPTQHMQVPMQGPHYYSNPMLPLGVGQPPPSVTYNGMGASAPPQAYPQHVRQPGVMQQPLTYQQRPMPPQFGGALGVGNRQQHPWP